MADIQVKKALISAPRGTANIFRLKGPTINERTIRKIARLALPNPRGLGLGHAPPTAGGRG